MVKLFLRKFIFNFSPFALTITILCLLVFLAGRQVYRSSANDPQIELAAKVAEYLNTGGNPAEIGQGEQIDMAGSLAIHISVFDNDGKAVASNARLNGAAPTVPVDELETAQKKGRSLFTWKPATGVCAAAVAVPSQAGTVVVAKSLRLVDERIAGLAWLTGITWLVSLVVIAGLTVAIIYQQFNVLRNPM